jgi:predicted alpha/beta superfamily hydrolase
MKIIIDKLYFKELELERTIRVYLPSSLEINPDLKLPVIYMHDGQNLFDRSTSAYGHIWDVHNTIESKLNDSFKGVIVVGIDNGGGLERLDEYSPWVSTKVEELKELNLEGRNVGGLGEKYSLDLVNTLKPYIDNKYPVLTDKSNTYIIGSSMGGVISLYIGVKYPEIFSSVGAFSTAVWFCEEELLNYIKNIDIKSNQRWYLDIGTNETSNPNYEAFNKIYVDGTMNVYNSLKTIGVKDDNIKLIIEDGAVHNEDAWARRFKNAFEWIIRL